jgi:hypothetical protein
MAPHDGDDAPPPYSAVDPLQLQPVNDGPRNDDTNVEDAPPHLELPIRLGGGDAPVLLTPSATASTTSESRSEGPSTVPVHFASAAGYFTERPPPAPAVTDEKRGPLIHHLTVYARSQGKDFPRRPRCWNPRADKINQHDWDTLLTFVFPPQLGPAASSNHLHRQVRAEIERDRKDRPQETDGDRKARIEAVLSEWNECFFVPRGTFISWVYIADLENGPASPLCPQCYPAATQASQNRGRVTRSRSSDAPIPVALEQPTHNIPRRPLPRSDTDPNDAHRQAANTPSPAPLSRPGVAVPLWAPISNPASPNFFRNPHIPQNQSPSSWNSNPLAWANQLSARAQQYADKISVQAQQYGKLIEESAMARGRQVEQYGRVIEENALAHGRRVEETGDRLSLWASGLSPRQNRAPWSPTDRNNSVRNSLPDSCEQYRQQRRQRRSSTASNSSNDSYSSVDTLSTVSDLDPEDLSTVRTQLQSLNDYHHRELHSAAVELRSHLRVLQQSRRDAIARSPRGGFRSRQGPWGRWESPEEEQQREQRRQAMKKESKALREAFAQVNRRAKQETREIRKLKHERRRLKKQLPRIPSTDEGDTTKEVCPATHLVNRTTSDPGPSEPSPPAETSTPPALNAREAAKAWADAQRAKVKEIQKANKDRRKAVEKAYKEREKQMRKAAKQQPHGGTLAGTTARSSESSLTSPPSAVGTQQPWSWHNASTQSLSLGGAGAEALRASSTLTPTSAVSVSTIPWSGDAAQESGVISRESNPTVYAELQGEQGRRQELE